MKLPFFQAPAPGAFPQWKQRLTRAVRFLERAHVPVFFLLCAAVAIPMLRVTLFTTCYAVYAGDTYLGTVSSADAVEEARHQVEEEVSALLGQPCTVEAQVTYEKGLTQETDFDGEEIFEEYFYSTVSGIVQRYTLTVDGELIGASQAEEDLRDMLEEIQAQYRTAYTVDSGFVEAVELGYGYVDDTVEQNLGEIYARLTANTTGQTTYTVAEGDTMSEIAAANHMSLSELMALNPEVDPALIHIGDVVNVKEVIPFLSVWTVDNLTYTEAIPSPVEEQPDESMYIGDTAVLTQGEDGEQLVNADVRYVNGSQTQRTVLTCEITKQPTTTVMAVGTKEKPRTASTGTYIWPTSGTISSYFGYRNVSVGSTNHAGIDIAAPKGQAIVAADGGTVTYSGWKTGYGNVVVITHDSGAQTYYGHCSALLVSAGDKVYQGQTIAKVGSTGVSTGNHCHFEIRIGGTAVNPLKYLP